jgi:hypothetical protein
LRLLEAYAPKREEEVISLSLADLHQVASIQRMLSKNDLDIYLLQPQTNDLEQLFIDLTSTPS